MKPNVCARCGGALDGQDREYCTFCLPPTKRKAKAKTAPAPKPEGTPHEMAAYHAGQLANALELLSKRRTPEYVAQARRTLDGYYTSEVNPLATLSAKEKHDRPTLQVSGRAWREIYYALETKASAIEQGEYGPNDEEVDTTAWAAELRAVMKRIEASGVRV